MGLCITPIERESHMGYWEIIRTDVIDDITYTFTAGTGFPCCMERDCTFIACERIIEKTKEPIMDRKPPNICNSNFTRLVYDTPPIIIAFYTLNAPSFDEDLKLFHEHYEKELNCPYLIGYFYHTCHLFASDKVYLDGKHSFSVALFDKKKKEALDFALSFVHKTKRLGALLVADRGTALDAATIHLNNTNRIKKV